MRIVRGCIDQLLLNPLLLLPLGALFSCIGVLLLLDQPDSSALSARVERLAPLGAAQLGDSRAGQAALVEGRISQATIVRVHSLVLYLLEEYRSCGDSSCWVEVERLTPPLLLDLPGGQVRIINTDYELLKTAAEVPVAEPGWTTGAVRYRGFEVGSPVLAVGTLVQNGTAAGLRADFLFAGTRDQLLAEQASYRSRLVPAGLLISLFGGLGLALGAWQLRRFLRSASS